MRSAGFQKGGQAAGSTTTEDIIYQHNNNKHHTHLDIHLAQLKPSGEGSLELSMSQVLAQHEMEEWMKEGSLVFDGVMQTFCIQIHKIIIGTDYFVHKMFHSMLFVAIVSMHTIFVCFF